MAGTFTDYWRIVKPAPSKSGYVSASPETSKLYSNFSWYTKVLKGTSSRFSKYTQYKNMDSDVFVARALDTIAEEMTQLNARTNLPFDISYQNENNVEVPESITMTVRAALRHWCDTQDLTKINFDIARVTVKYGDCFFRKTSDFKRWKYVDPGDIIGISIDEDGKPEYYHLRTGEKSKTGSFGDVEIVPAAGIVHFSLTSSMGENGPFGESPLWASIKAFRHLSLLEDSVIIYRIVRAPERRVFFIDVGNMPPQRVKSYLESIRNEMKQKRIPNESGGTDKIDSVYNPICLALDTKIPLLDGRTCDLNQLIVEHEQGKQNWAYSCHPTTGVIVPGLISWAGVTRKNAEVVKITLDNGETITCTPDHKFPVLGRGFVEAKDLTPDDPLISHETSEKKLGSVSYQRVFDHGVNEWVFTHRMVAEFFRSIGKHQTLTFSPEFVGEEQTTVHHKNFDGHDNSPGNLQWMHQADHLLYHRFVKREWWEQLRQDPVKYEKLKTRISESLKKYYERMSDEDRARLSVAASERVHSWINDPARNQRFKNAVNKLNREHVYRLETDESYRDRYTSYICGKGPKFQNKPVIVNEKIAGRLAQLVKQGDLNRLQAMQVASADDKFVSLLTEANSENVGQKGVKFIGRLTENVLRAIYESFNYTGWKHFKRSAATFNHRVVSVEYLAERQDTGCITIDQDHKYHDYHTFALSAGVYTKNSQTEDYFFAQTANGRGSRVESLSGGENLGEIADLNYFQNKFLQGLRIPSSYMRGGAENGAQLQDGKVGIAYIEELRFANFVARLQNKLNDTFDDHFKEYMKAAGLKIDTSIFKIRLVDPQNFMKYKQAEVDEKMLSNFSTIKDATFVSARYKLMHYLGWSEDDVQENEAMLKQELGIPEGGIDERLTELRMMYDPKWLEGRPDIKVDEKWDDHSAGEDDTGGETDEEAAAADEDLGGKDELAASGKEAKKPDQSDDGGEDKPSKEPSVDDLKKAVSGI